MLKNILDVKKVKQVKNKILVKINIISLVNKIFYKTQIEELMLLHYLERRKKWFLKQIENLKQEEDI